MAAIRTLNRLECVGETLRAALNILATVAPDWLQEWVPQEWFKRYGRAVDEYRLPKGIAARTEYAETIGADGMQLLTAIYEDETAPPWLRQLPIVETFRQTWVINIIWIMVWYVGVPPRIYHLLAIVLTLLTISSARYSIKRTTTWSGYKVHITETCDEGDVHLNY